MELLWVEIALSKIRMVPLPVEVFSMLKMGSLKFLMFAPVVILKGWVQLEWNHLLYFFVLVESISWILRGTYLQTYLRYLDHGFRLNRSPRVPSCGTNITTSPKTTHLMCMFFFQQHHWRWFVNRPGISDTWIWWVNVKMVDINIHEWRPADINRWSDASWVPCTLRIYIDG